MPIELFGPPYPEGDSADYSVKGLAADLAMALQARDLPAPGPDQAVILGSSSGGYVAQQRAIDHPELVGAWVLVGSPITLQGRPAFADDVERLSDPVSAE